MKLFEARKAKALALLKATGIREGNYLPPAVRVLWRLGVRVPPPHFAGFAGTALAFGSFFALSWGAAMWWWLWRDSGMSLQVAAIGAALAGLLFGLAMASYYALGRRKHRLPTWSKLV